jgi:hypothetical protein
VDSDIMTGAGIVRSLRRNYVGSSAIMVILPIGVRSVIELL